MVSIQLRTWVTPEVDALYAQPGFDIFALSSDTGQMPISVYEPMTVYLSGAATRGNDISAMHVAENPSFLVSGDAVELADMPCCLRHFQVSEHAFFIELTSR